MGPGYSDQVVNQWAAGIAKWAADTAGHSVMSLVQMFGAATEPNFASIGPAYNRVLAIALLLLGAVTALALIERAVGGARGASLEVLPRTLFACLLAFGGLGLVEYGAHYANLLASAWDADFGSASNLLIAKVNAVYVHPAAGGQALGSAGGMILVALLTTLLALLLNIELILRAALILVTTAFIPLVAILAIWPRLSGAVAHLAEFLGALLLSKFLMVTAVYIGFNLIARGFAGGQPGQPSPNGMITGLATLAIAAFAPLALWQGVRFSHSGAASVSRGWTATGVRATVGAATVIAGVAGKAAGGAIGVGRRVASSAGREVERKTEREPHRSDRGRP
jgi:hypothetical protein